MKKFKKLFSFLLCFTLGFGILGLVGCENEPPAPPAETYTLVFDYQNTEIPNVELVVEKTAVNDRTNWPTLEADDNGWAGEWITASNEDDVITLIKNYGDGTEENPYLVSNIDQFQVMIDMGRVYETKYINDEGETVDVAEATKLVKTSDLLDTYYIKNTNGKWNVFDSYSSKKKFFKLVNDIDLTNFYGNVSSNQAAISIDGGKYDVLDNTKVVENYSIIGLRGGIVPVTGAGLYEIICDTTFKNITVVENSDIAALASHARGGKNVFENVVINSSSDYITLGSGDGNESAFLCHALGTSEVVFKDCVNNANYASTAPYFGIFVGGYPRNSKMTFINCVNNGNVVASGLVGMLFGNNSAKPGELVVTNCVNNGSFNAKVGSHILIAETGTAFFTAEECAKYDVSVAGEVTTKENFFTEITQKYTAVADLVNHKITVSAQPGDKLERGSYELIVSSSFNGVNIGGNKLISVKEVIEVYDDKESIEFDKYFKFIDVTKYEGNLPADDSGVWKLVEGYANHRYFLDPTQGFVVDCGGAYEATTSLSFVIVAKDTNSKIVEFVVG